MGDTINIPWQIANTQRDPLQTAQDSALKGLDIGQRRAGINALRGINFDDPSTVNRALNASAQAGLLDQANAVTTVGLARRQAQTTRSALDLADEGIQAEADKTPAHLKLMQDGANAVHTLLGITDPAERKAQPDKYAQEFQQRHVPPQNIAEIIGDLSDDGLKAHGAFLTAAAQGQELPDHPTGYGASRTILDDPIYAQARDQLTGPFAHPIVQAALARGGRLKCRRLSPEPPAILSEAARQASCPLQALQRLCRAQQAQRRRVRLPDMRHHRSAHSIFQVAVLSKEHGSQDQMATIHSIP